MGPKEAIRDALRRSATDKWVWCKGGWKEVTKDDCPFYFMSEMTQKDFCSSDGKLYGTVKPMIKPGFLVHLPTRLPSPHLPWLAMLSLQGLLQLKWTSLCQKAEEDYRNTKSICLFVFLL